MTGRCLDKTIGDKLMAYELGMLDAEETEQFELHLLECVYCSTRAHEFRTAAALLRHDSDVQNNKTSPSNNSLTDTSQIRQ